MKFMCLVLCLLYSFCAKAELVLNVQKDLAKYKLANVPDIAENGACSRIQAIIDYNHSERKDSALTLLFPAGYYLFDTTIQPQDNITFKLASKAVWYSTSRSLFGASGSMAEVIGHSNVKFIGEPGATITNGFSKFIYALIQYKADPRKCTGNEVSGITLKNSWCHAALAGANAGSDDADTYWTDLTFRKDSLLNLYNPHHPHILVGSDYHTDADCNGIDILQAYHTVLIDGVVVINTGGDNIRGFGLNKGLSKDPSCGHVEIRNCYLKNGNMNLEINGNYSPNLLYIHNNRMFYPSYVGGYNISAQGKPLIVQNNYLLSADNSNMELSAYGGDISGNICKQIAWRSTAATGFHHAPFEGGSSRAFNLYFYGFLAAIHHNTFVCDTTGKGASSPAEWNGISPVTRASNFDTAYNRRTMNGLAYMGGQFIHHNTFSGQTHRIYDNTNDTTQNVVFADNIINATSIYGLDELVTVKGFGMKILRNRFNMKGAAVPKGGHAVIKRIGGNGEQVQDNVITNGGAWYNNSIHHYKFIQ